jgi:hypothetical protein
MYFLEQACRLQVAATLGRSEEGDVFRSRAARANAILVTRALAELLLQQAGWLVAPSIPAWRYRPLSA